PPTTTGRNPAVSEKRRAERSLTMGLVSPLSRPGGQTGMFKGINITTIFVLDKDQALDFYVNKLGLEVASDIQKGTYRWLTVRVPGDPDRELSLEVPGPPAMDESTAAQVRELVTKGAMSYTVLLTD